MSDTDLLADAVKLLRRIQPSTPLDTASDISLFLQRYKKSRWDRNQPLGTLRITNSGELLVKIASSSPDWESWIFVGYPQGSGRGFTNRPNVSFLATETELVFTPK